jgi:hypothetical protein
MKKLLLVPVIFVLSSCAVFGPFTTEFKIFKEPVNGDRARVRVVGKEDYLGGVWAFPGKDHLDWSTPGAGTVFGMSIITSKGFLGRSLGMPPSLSKGPMAEFYVKAGEPITLLANGISIVTGYHEDCKEVPLDSNDPKSATMTVCDTVPDYDKCSAGRYFTPEKDVDYEVVYSEQNVSTCSLDVYTLDAQGNRNPMR